MSGINKIVNEVLEYLVLKKMAGRPEVLMALLDYINGELSPSMAYERYGVSKHQLRGFVQRIYEKSGDRKIADAVIRIAVPIILSSVDSRVKRDSRPETCGICGKRLYNVFPEDHIKKHHSDMLKKENEKMYQELKKVIESRKKVVSVKNV